MMSVGKLLPEAARCFLKKPATVAYPRERLPMPAGLRGAPVVHEEACIGCCICARQCPAKAIEMVETGEKTPRPAFHYDICIFCAVCAEVCPKKAIEMTQHFELASVDRTSLTRHPGKAGDLVDELQARLAGATGVAVLGVGYELGSDDGAGLLAAKGILRRRPDLPVYLTGSAPENYTGPVVKAHPSHVIFLDAAAMGAGPGTVACIGQGEIKGTHFSTHTLPLSTIMEYLAMSIGAKSFAVGIQPAREGFGEEVSPEVQAAAERVAEAVVEALAELGL